LSGTTRKLTPEPTKEKRIPAFRIGPRHGMIVVAVVNGEMCVRRLNRKNGNWVLDPENRDF